MKLSSPDPKEVAAMATTAAKEPRAQLTRERIVSAALALVDREGLSALSMRRLGAELGVDPMAIYYYVPSKDALLDAIVEAVMADIDLGIDDPAAPPEDRVMCAARAYRDVMLAHANALPIVLSRGPRTPDAMRPVELLIGILRDAGLPPAQAMAGMNAIAATVRGLVGMIAGGDEPPTPEELEALTEQFPAEEFPHLREAAVCHPELVEADFEFGIRALARGLVERTAK
jgi:TetR/AcrR family transcriptional regulator, tetracycline repressor protein